jgi:pimeloyl-ACP methyl ester carboxylesterase
MAVKKYWQEKIFPKLVGLGINATSILSKKIGGDIALKVFATPRNGFIRERQMKFLSTFEQSTLKSGKRTVAIYKKGSGSTTILLCHGWESNASRWKRLVQYLDTINECTIIMMDAPAHGATDGKYFTSLEYGACILTVCEKYKPNIIIGHSVGAGSIAYANAELAPLGADKIVLLASPNKFKAIMNSYKQLLHLSNRTIAALTNTIQNRYNYTVENYHVAEYAKKLTAHTLLIHDKDDVVTKAEFSEQIVANIANGKLILTEGYGHSLQGAKIYAMIGEFLFSH